MSEILNVLQKILDPKGTPVAMVLGAILIGIAYLVIKAGPGVLKMMKEEHESHKVEVNQITSSAKEAAIEVAKEHRETVWYLVDQHEDELSINPSLLLLVSNRLAYLYD